MSDIGAMRHILPSLVKDYSQEAIIVLELIHSKRGGRIGIDGMFPTIHA